MTRRTRIPKSDHQRQMKLAAKVMNEDREVLRALAGRPENTPAIAAEKTGSRATSLRSGLDAGRGKRD